MGKERLAFIRKLKKDSPHWEEIMRYDSEAVKIAQTAKIQEGCIIGLDGFAYEMNEHGWYEKFPHFCRVVIGERVDIYAGTTVQRGSTRDTVIHFGTKIAGHCQIGHNSQIGSYCLIGARTLVCGSAELGDNVITGEFVRIAPHVKVGNNVKISSYTNVTRDIPDNSHVRGNPGEIL